MTYGADWFSVVVVLAAAAFYVYDYLFVDDGPRRGRSNTPSGSGRPTRFRWPSTSAGSNWRSTIAPNRSRRSRDQSGYRSEDRPHTLPSLSHSTSCTAPTATGSKRSTISARQRPTRSKSTSNDERPLHPLLIDVPIAGRPGPDRAGRRRTSSTTRRTRSSRRSARRPPGGSSPTA